MSKPMTEAECDRLRGALREACDIAEREHDALCRLRDKRPGEGSDTWARIAELRKAAS